MERMKQTNRALEQLNSMRCSIEPKLKDEGGGSMLMVSQYIGVGNDETTLTANPEYIKRSSSAIGLIGPPGSGKSTISNTIIYILKIVLFKVGNSYETVTEGMWVISNYTRDKIESNHHQKVYKDVVDVEGHNNSLERSWKLSMLLCLMCEELVICNRDARAITLIQTIQALKLGIDKCRDQGLQSITKQIFIVLSDPDDEESDQQLLNSLKSILPTIQFIKVLIPQFSKNDIRSYHNNNNESLSLSFHPKLIESIKIGIIDKIQPRLDSIDLSTKSTTIQSLLNQLNNNSISFNHINETNQKFFIADCKRMIQESKSKVIELHIELAKNKPFKPTFNQFMEDVSDVILDVDFKSSTFYNQSCIIPLEWLPNPLIPKLELESIYKSQYNLKCKSDRF